MKGSKAKRARQTQKHKSELSELSRWLKMAGVGALVCLVLALVMAPVFPAGVMSRLHGHGHGRL